MEILVEMPSEKLIGTCPENRAKWQALIDETNARAAADPAWAEYHRKIAQEYKKLREANKILGIK